MLYKEYLEANMDKYLSFHEYKKLVKAREEQQQIIDEKEKEELLKEPVGTE